MKFFSILKDKVTLDVDTYALFLEGWDNEHNLTKARNTFGEIIFYIRWMSSNRAAYNSFLSTLINGSEMEEALCVMAAMNTNKWFLIQVSFGKHLKSFINARTRRILIRFRS